MTYLSDHHNAARQSEEKPSPFFPITIITPRLVMREIEADDVHRFHEISEDPDFHYYCFDGSFEKAQEFVEEALRTQQPNPQTAMRDNHMLAVERLDNGELIGHASIERVDYIPGVDYEPNYFVDAQAQGKGYGTEVLVNTVHYAFSRMRLPAMTSTQHPDNAVALHNAATKIGFNHVRDVMLDTVNGPEPRLLSQVVPNDFYAIRARDTRTLIVDANGQAMIFEG